MSTQPGHLMLLQVVSNSIPAFHGVIEQSIRIRDLVKGFYSYKDQWKNFDIHVQDAISQVAAVVASSKTAQAKASDKIEQLLRMLESIAKEIEDERSLPRINRAARFMRDPQRIARMKERLDDAIRSFQLSVTSSNLIMSNQTYNMAVCNRAMCEIAQRSTFISANLCRRDNSSWNPKLVCLPDTRSKLLEQIFAWVKNPQGTRNLLNRCDETSPEGAQILLLTGVAGAGKSTVSHSVARHYHGTGQLVSSFFFNRRHASDNNKSSVFLNTIAADLANMDPLIAQHMCEVLSQDWRLPSRLIPEQFSKLVIEPLHDYHSSEPAILVIDGLDEEYDQALVDELCGGAARLPNNFRIFITSRMNPKLDELSREKRVCWLELDIGSEENKDDIASKFIPQSLAQLAKAKDLGQDWPGQEIQDRFTLKAGGLFLWVIVVCKYLRGRQDPTRELERILSINAPLEATAAEAQMDELYAMILNAFDWKDDSFAASYHWLMGTTLTAKTPLTVVSMEDLLQQQPLAQKFTFQSLSPLLTGMRQQDHMTIPVQALHQSLHDFYACEKSIRTFV
ncbi:hypothetical protein RhiJN_16533 [Ceratobasidium sp. AG-Ba]|nr:hypothetical protein RhiJN_16533 [Ceratobasidium sp. AG-Ba]